MTAVSVRRHSGSCVANAWCHGGPSAFLTMPVAGLLVYSACCRLALWASRSSARLLHSIDCAALPRWFHPLPQVLAPPCRCRGFFFCLFILAFDLYRSWRWHRCMVRGGDGGGRSKWGDETVTATGSLQSSARQWLVRRTAHRLASFFGSPAGL